MKGWAFITGLAAVQLLSFAADWRTYGADPQRTGWAIGEKRLTKSNVQKLKLEWSLKLDNTPVELYSLTAPVVSVNTITPKGFRDLVITAGSSDNLYAIDADTGKLEWKKTFEREAGDPPNRNTGGWLCPNAIVATPLYDAKTRTVHVISTDGRLHSLNVVNGEDRVPPIQFVPPYSKSWSMNLVDGVLYTALSQGCNRAKNGVYAMDLKDPKRPVTVFQTTGGVWGRAGVAIGADGKVYGEIGDGTFDPEAGKYSDAVIKLEPKTLKLLDYYAPKNQRFIDKKDLDMGNISPVVFPWKGRELIAASGKEGAIFLLDSKSLGGDDHRTPLYRSPLFTNEEANFMMRGLWGSFGTWEDGDTRWLLAAAYGPPHPEAPAFPVQYGKAENGSIMAFKVVEKGGKPALDPAWMSVDMMAPDPVTIANGVVFALSTGDEYRQVDSGGRLLASKDRAGESKPAILYALDAQTGKVLYSSQNLIKSFTHFSGISISEGRVYVVTADSTVYAFGLGDESSD
jgi:outer membrane protein assembly factor BamB